MKHYRVNKLAKPGGPVVRTKDTLAATDREAIEAARADPECPVCEVFEAGRKVGSIT
jgi:hypothetical protein